MPTKTAAKSKRGVKAYETGQKLEDRVGTWLTKQGYTCKKRVLARGKTAARPYEVDIYATKGIVFKHHLWAECKAHKVKRTFIHKLVESARDVKELNNDNEDVQTWSPNMLMLVTDEGFDSDAVKLADKYKIYCVHANKTFEFVGKQKKTRWKMATSQNSTSPTTRASKKEIFVGCQMTKLASPLQLQTQTTLHIADTCVRRTRFFSTVEHQPILRCGHQRH